MSYRKHLLRNRSKSPHWFEAQCGLEVPMDRRAYGDAAVTCQNCMSFLWQKLQRRPLKAVG